MIDTHRRDSLMTVLSFLLLVAGFLFVFYLPGRRETVELHRQIAQAQQTIGTIPARIAEMEALHEQARRREDYLARTEALLPRQSNMSSVIRKVADLARHADLTVTRVEPIKPVEHESHSIIPLRLGISGNFSGIAHFLHGMETHDQLFTVEELSLRSGNHRTQQGVDADIHFAVHIRTAEFDDYGENDASSGAAATDLQN